MEIVVSLAYFVLLKLTVSLRGRDVRDRMAKAGLHLEWLFMQNSVFGSSVFEGR